MSEYCITCCSTADMPASYFEENQIPYTCFHFMLDGKEYPDDLGKTVPFDKFYQMITDGAQPTTAQVNTEQYAQLFESVLKQGKDVLHLTLSSGISGTYNSANLARMQMEEKYPDRKIFVIDSLAGCISGASLFNG